MSSRSSALAGALLVGLAAVASIASSSPQETWQRGGDPRYPQRDEAYRQDPPASDDPSSRPNRSDPYPSNRPADSYPPRLGASAPPSNDAYSPRPNGAPVDDAYHPPR